MSVNETLNLSGILQPKQGTAENVRKKAFTAVGSGSFSTALKQAEKNIDAASSENSAAGTVDFDSLFTEASRTYGVSKKLLIAVARQESGINPNAVSSNGAEGVMQLMPDTARALGVKDATDPYENIMAGAKLLRDKIREFGSVPLALAAYNAGSGAVRKYGGIPPYQETQKYVKNVLAKLNDTNFKTKSSYNYSGNGSRENVGSAGNLNRTNASEGLESLFGNASESGIDSRSLKNAALIFESSLLSGLGSGLTEASGLLSGTSGLLSGTSGLSAGLFGTNSGLGIMQNALTSLLASTSREGAAGNGSGKSDRDSETVTLDKKSYENLLEIMKLQMLMRASSGLGSFGTEDDSMKL